MNYKERNKEIIDRRKGGESLFSLATSYSLSSTRIDQIVRWYGGDKPTDEYDNLGLSTRATNALRNSRYSIDELKKMSDEELLKIDNFGRLSLAEFRDITKTEIEMPPYIHMNEKEDFRISACDGKYTYIFYFGGKSEVLRHGEAWKDTTGDGCLLAFASDLHELIKKPLKRHP